jgi:hypothetical protein
MAVEQDRDLQNVVSFDRTPVDESVRWALTA